MNVDLNKTVRDLAVENPAATRVFEKFGIDYCCGGGKSLREACAAASVAPDKLLELLQAADQGKNTNGNKDWKEALLSDLIDHIWRSTTPLRARNCSGWSRCWPRCAQFTGSAIP